MKLLLVVGSAKDVFIYNMAKWLKASMDVDIDVFEFYSSTQQNDYRYYKSVSSARNVWFTKIKGFRVLTTPFYYAKELDSFLIGKHYDIIHCHWIVPPVVLSRSLKQHCNKLYATFWGGELLLKIGYSNKLYRKTLNKFLNEIDYLVNSEVTFNKFCSLYPQLTNKFKYAHFGSAALDYLYDLMNSSSKIDIKKQWDIPIEKYSVLIGYSGKRIHQHIEVIRALKESEVLKDKIHLLSVMTRGSNPAYAKDIEKELQASGYSYTMIKGRFLSDEEVASIRYATDFVLQLSTFDGFSRSIVEALCAGSIVIYGNWLNDYPQFLESDGFQAIAANSFNDAVKILESVIRNYSSYIPMSMKNSESGQTNTWKESIKDWVNAYQI